MPQGRIAVGRVEDFTEGSITPLTVAGQEVVLIRQHDTFYAMPDRCTHANFPLHDGELLPGVLKCIRHGATFDLVSGRPTLPAVKKIRLYDTQVEDGTVYISYQET